MKLLFLDDYTERYERMVQVCPEAVHAKTAPEMIALLQSTQWDVVCLDHDLGGEMFVDPSRSDCGMAVVRWMVEHRPVVGRVIVHSANFESAPLMCAALTAAGYAVEWIPFASEEIAAALVGKKVAET
jgi:NAD+-processing family protein with receiver domain